MIFAVLGTQTHHCGFNWPWGFWDHQPEFHDLHHAKFNGNYGNIGFLDWLHGTTLHLKDFRKLQPTPVSADSAVSSSTILKDDAEEATTSAESLVGKALSPKVISPPKCQNPDLDIRERKGLRLNAR